MEKIGTADPLGTRHYGGIAVRDTAGLRWIIADHHGTPMAQIDPATLTIARRRSMPYGEARGPQATGWKGTKGYLGGTKDDTGLTHLGAREYDPTLGRFISVDPLMDLADPQQWHAYAYSNNNPATFSDPSGLIPTCDNDGNVTCAPPPPPPGEIPHPDPDGGGGDQENGCKGNMRSASCAPPTNCDFAECQSPPVWAKYADYVQKVALQLGLDPALLLGTLIIEGWTCFYLEPLCFHAQLGETLIRKASIGITNIKEATFEGVKAEFPEVLGEYKWMDLLVNDELAIVAMGLIYKSLERELAGMDVSKSAYSKTELLRFGYQSGLGGMREIAGGVTMKSENAHINKRFAVVYREARHWYSGTFPGIPVPQPMPIPGVR